MFCTKRKLLRWNQIVSSQRGTGDLNHVLFVCIAALILAPRKQMINILPHRNVLWEGFYKWQCCAVICTPTVKCSPLNFYQESVTRMKVALVTRASPFSTLWKAFGTGDQQARKYMAWLFTAVVPYAAQYQHERCFSDLHVWFLLCRTTFPLV